MAFFKKYYFQLILVFLLIAANWFMLDAMRVEEWYATGIYIYISRVLQFLLGWLPFSVGDLLYTTAIIYIIFTLHKSFKRPILQTLNRLFIVVSIVWLAFHILWGFNYYRTSISEQFNLDRGEVKKEEISAFANYTLTKANLFSNSQPTTHNSQPLPRHGGQAVKPSLFGIIGNYIDLADYKVFAEKYYGPVDKFVTWFYGGFLNLNNQPEGMMSYNRGMVYTMRYLKIKGL